MTMLFCDVVGSTAMAERLDPEAWTEIMNEVFELLIVPIDRYEGTVARLMGDAICRTLFRLLVNRRLLEWITAAQSKHRRRAGWHGLYGTMAGSLVVAVLMA